MEPVEAEGHSIDEAIDNALRMLGVSRDRVEIEILENATRGLFGLGGRKARVRAALRNPIDAESLTEAERSPTPPAAVEGITTVPPAEPNSAAMRACTVLEQIVKLLDVQAGVILRQEPERILLDLTGDSSGVLIGRRGQMLDALEYLLNRIVVHEGDSTRIVVDSQNYRTRRSQSLEDLARRMGDQAKKKRKTITLNPMSPRDRRIVHLVLQEDPSLSTKSSGKGYFRKLIIIPAGAGPAGARKDTRDSG
jgi:spoIIIJ-associated protein